MQHNLMKWMTEQRTEIYKIEPEKQTEGLQPTFHPPTELARTNV